MEKIIPPFKVYASKDREILEIRLVDGKMIDELPKMSTEWELRIAGYDYIANTLPDAPSWGGQCYMKSWRSMCGCDEICPIDVSCPC